MTRGAGAGDPRFRSIAVLWDVLAIQEFVVTDHAHH